MHDTSRPLRVALFTDSDVFAGTERHMLDLAVGLLARGVDVRIACPVPGALAAKAKAAAIPVIDIPKRGAIDFNAIKTIKRLLKSGELDLVHSHNGRTALATAIARRLAKNGRCVTTQHFLEPAYVSRHGIKGMVSRLAHHWVDHRTNHIIAVSHAARAGAIKRGEAAEDHITCIPNGIPLPDPTSLKVPLEMRAELGIPSNAPLIVCAARLEKEKDISTLIAAMPKVRDSMPGVVCLIAGEGSEHDMLSRQIAAYRLEPSVKLLGFRPDALSIINAADLFVLPSLAEPFGLVLLEAMALSKPVIATRAGGPIEIVDDGVTGLLVSPSDQNALTDAIARLLGDLSSSKKLGDAGRERFIARYTADQMACATLELYHRVLGAA